MSRLPAKRALLAAAAAFAASAPLAAQDAPVDRSQDLAWHNAQQAALAERAASDEWYGLEDGLLWRRIAGDGTGPSPTVADTVTVHYAGTFVDGSGFDSSYERGAPATFPLGRLIKAWQMAIPEMSVGDTIEIAVPASLGYGTQGKGPIPGGATLIFKVELIGIEGS
ncbi:FKBP-type peptidyl-prolyl cis-trans isomerase [Erythrobacter sp. HKB08]|uniref:FKBP-type peptidyl-prolyl cis-trans isomerase n=1 Tax=Erythrobacter sp. HKB08 TaxID=2502843 RepID=UPI001F323E3E|nr:FKBP-type peptidyl-prolyl cis-trans isomerase [Erythrobacter sp. HKB08]